MRRRRCKLRRLRLLRTVLNRMLVNMVMELIQENQLCVAGWDRVVNRGVSLRVMEKVMVMVMVMGSKW